MSAKRKRRPDNEHLFRLVSRPGEWQRIGPVLYNNTQGALLIDDRAGHLLNFLLDTFKNCDQARKTSKARKVFTDEEEDSFREIDSTMVETDDRAPDVEDDFVSDGQADDMSYEDPVTYSREGFQIPPKEDLRRTTEARLLEEAMEQACAGDMPDCDGADGHTGDPVLDAMFDEEAVRDAENF